MNDENLFFNLGAIAACEEHDLSPEDIPYYEGMRKNASTDDEMIRKVASALGDFLFVYRGNTAPAHHFKEISKSATITPEIKDTVLDSLMYLEKSQKADAFFEKSAKPNPIQAAGQGIARLFGLGAAAGSRGKGLIVPALATALAAGGSAGTLGWMMNRDVNELDKRNNYFKDRINEYNSKAKALEEKLKAKYNYDVNDKEDNDAEKNK